MLSRFERGQRLPVAARLPALLWIVFFYSLKILKMVDFRGFKHSPVAERGKGGGNKHRGVKKSHKKHFSHRGAYLKRVTATPAVDPPCCGSFFYSLNILKMVDFRGFKHSDVPNEGTGGRLRMIWHRHVAWGEYRCGPRARCSARRPMTKYCGFPTADALPGPSACILASRRGRH
ncbi:hypothetical protein ACOMHN_021109 [Nucella lapillus]